MGETQEEGPEETLECWRMMEQTDKHMRETKAINTGTLTRGSGAGEVSEEGKGQVR